MLHKSNINVVIAVILLYRKSLYDLPGPKYKNSVACEIFKKGRGQLGENPSDNLRAPDIIRLFRPSRGPKKIFRLLIEFAGGCA